MPRLKYDRDCLAYAIFSGRSRSRCGCLSSGTRTDAVALHGELLYTEIGRERERMREREGERYIARTREREIERGVPGPVHAPAECSIPHLA